MLFSAKIPFHVAARLTELSDSGYPICYDLPLFATVRHYSHYSRLFALFETIRTIRTIRYSGFPDTPQPPSETLGLLVRTMRYFREKVSGSQQEVMGSWKL